MMSIRSKLSVMMFLQFFIWGAWLPPSFGYFGAGGLGFSEWEQFGLNIMFPLSAILAMFFSNQFADRNFAAEKFLAASHLIGGVTMLAFGVMAWRHFQAEVASTPSYWPYFICMAVHCLVYVPTISVTNSIAFANIQDAQNDFGRVRLWGTIGWIAASWPFIFILADWAKIGSVSDAGGMIEWIGKACGTSLEGQALNQGKSWAFITSGIASLMLAGFALGLPHTPPKPVKEGENSLAWLEAIKLLKYPFLLVLFIVTFIDATVHDGFFFFAFTYLGKVGVPQQWIQPAMSVGQLAEIGTMAFLGLVLTRLGWRTTMIIGILGHTVRFAIFAFIYSEAPSAAAPYIAVAANVLHGVCYAFFFATLYILVDEVFPKDARTSAQGLFNFLILGMGPIAARYLWPFIQGMYTTKSIVDGKEVDVVNYGSVLLYPSGFALIAAVLLFIFFHPPKSEAQMKGPITAAH